MTKDQMKQVVALNREFEEIDTIRYSLNNLEHITFNGVNHISKDDNKVILDYLKHYITMAMDKYEYDLNNKLFDITVNIAQSVETPEC